MYNRNNKYKQQPFNVTIITLILKMILITIKKLPNDLNCLYTQVTFRIAQQKSDDQKTTGHTGTRHHSLGHPNIHMRPSGMFLYSHFRNLNANLNVELVIVVSFRTSCHKWDRSS